MKIFISWSGPREQRVAEALRDALPELCVADVQVFVSSKSITKGSNGTSVIEANLDESDYGIVLVSRDNQDAPWLNYEGGWLASRLQRPVATICLDLRAGDITSPLAPRQATQFESEDDMEELLRQIAELANPSISTKSFATLLKAVWPEIRDSWERGAQQVVPKQDTRTEHDMLAEIVERVRGLEGEVQAMRGRPAMITAAPKQSFESIALADLRSSILSGTRGEIHLAEHFLDDDPPRITLVSSPAASVADRNKALKLVKMTYPTAKVTISHIRALTGADEDGMRRFIVDEVERHD